jgi:hypothetical protein
VTFDYSQSGWEDATQVGYPDTAENIICAQVTCLSPFFVVEPLKISAPDGPVSVGTRVVLSVPYNGEVTAWWDFGEGTVAQATMDDGAWTGEHTYLVPGVYRVGVTLKGTGDSVLGSAVLEYVIVFDPEEGFVTGGGWIESPPGAYGPDPEVTGRANFGFVAKYKKGASVPTGSTEFRFRAAGLDFHSEAYDWLVVAGAKAMFKGTGTVKGLGSAKFMLTALDSSLMNSGEFAVDRFRIKIWTEGDGGVEDVLYDNALGDSSEASLTEIGGGSIIIHKK